MSAPTGWNKAFHVLLAGVVVATSFDVHRHVRANAVPVRREQEAEIEAWKRETKRALVETRAPGFMERLGSGTAPSASNREPGDDRGA